MVKTKVVLTTFSPGKLFQYNGSMVKTTMPTFQTTAYRYPFEQSILTGTILLVLSVITLTTAMTVSVAGFFILLMLVITYLSNNSQHIAVIQRSYQINARSPQDLTNLVNTCQARIQPGQVQIYVAPSNQLNAYTFGISGPKVIVMYSSLFKLMDADELRFILGHEMGHVSLGHTWLNSLVGGMAGIPTSFGASVLLNASFLWWNRACEYSADRAGLLACNNPAKAISTLVKLASGGKIQSQADLIKTLRLIESQEENVVNQLGEVFSNHPIIIRRIHALRQYTNSSQYKRLQARMNQNINNK
jgi:Zn-dependent protease with chaperone function